MCERVGDLETSLRAFVSSFDPALVTGTEASRVVGSAARIEAMAATLKAKAAVRAEDCGAWARAAVTRHPRITWPG